jgi:methionyl-tRNA synthetase
MLVNAEAAMARFEFHIALTYVWVFIKEMNVFLHIHQPWKHAKENKGFCAEILWIVARSLHAVALLLMPFMPEKMEMILFSLGVDASWRDTHVHTILKGNFDQPYLLTQIPILFEKIEKKIVEQKEHVKSAPEAEKVATTVSIDAVRAVELRVGTVINCTSVPKSTKLLLLTVDFGPQGEKQIVSGIREWYTPEQLIGEQALFVYNLQPREVFGIQSHGMILVAADETGKKQLVSPKAVVKNGSLLQ